MMVGIFFWLCIFFIGYTYFLYPAILFLITLGRRQQTIQSAGDHPSVTLLIAAYNEEVSIESKLENSLALHYPEGLLQILVAADGSDDRTVALVSHYANRGVALSYRPDRRGKMAAINRAMEQATGEIVLFSDANNLYDLNILSAMVRPFSDPRVGGVTGAKHIIKGDDPLGASEGLYWKYEAFIKEKESLLGCCTGVCGEVFAMRRNLFEAPGDKTINDDFALAMNLIRRGFRILYAGDAGSYEKASFSAEEEIARRARIIAGRYQAMFAGYRWLPFRNPLVLWQIISHKLLRPGVPLAMLGALLSNLLVVFIPHLTAGPHPFWYLAPPLGSELLALQIFFYGCAFLGDGRLSRGKIGTLLYLPRFLLNSNRAALIGFWRFLRGRQTTVWVKAQRQILDVTAIEAATKVHASKKGSEISIKDHHAVSKRG